VDVRRPLAFLCSGPRVSDSEAGAARIYRVSMGTELENAWAAVHDALPAVGSAAARRARGRASASMMVSSAGAGMVAAAIWAGAEPAAQRLLRTPYCDLRLLGALVPTRHWRLAGLVLHLVNGAAFGAMFGRIGGHGWKQGLVAAELENILLWPGMAVVDRVHPDRRHRAWPRLLTSARVFGYEVLMHALFGIVLGLLLDRRRRSPR